MGLGVCMCTCGPPVGGRCGACGAMGPPALPQYPSTPGVPQTARPIAPPQPMVIREPAVTSAEIRKIVREEIERAAKEAR